MTKPVRPKRKTTALALRLTQVGGRAFDQLRCENGDVFFVPPPNMSYAHLRLALEVVDFERPNDKTIKFSAVPRRRRIVYLDRSRKGILRVTQGV